MSGNSEPFPRHGYFHAGVDRPRAEAGLESVPLMFVTAQPFDQATPADHADEALERHRG